MKITHKDILNDNRIIEIIKNIDKNNNFYMSHGINHINSILKIIDELCILFDISEKNRELIKISGILHDIGRGIDNDHHEIASSNFARTYLKDKLDINDIDIICGIIENHSWKSNKSNKLEEILCFADKIDFSNRRLEDNYREKYNFVSVLEKITNIDLKIDGEFFVVRINTNNEIGLMNLLEEKSKYDIGIHYNVSKIATLFGYNYKIYFDNTLLFKGDSIYEISKDNI